MYKYFYLLSFLTAAFVNSALAADVPLASHSKIVAKKLDWSGPYVGLQFGLNNTAMTEEDYSQDETDDLFGHPAGSFFSLYGGYNFNLTSKVILGLEGNIDYGKLKRSTYVSLAPIEYISANNIQLYSLKQNLAGDLRARLGYNMGKFLPYIAGGVSFISFASSIDFDHLDNDKLDGEAIPKNNSYGWNLGAGLDYILSEDLLLNIDYRCRIFEDPKFSGKENGQIHSDSFIGSKFKIHSVRLGLAYKF